jgi:AcrR family transcriptional regulator
MARRPTSKQSADGKSQAPRKGTQRERLITAMIAVANRDGYARASVSAVIKQAKISKPTFYEYFQDREDCFAAALSSVEERLLDEVRTAVTEGPPEDAVIGGIRAILAFAGSHPKLARFLTNEPLAAGSSILDAREQGTREIARAIESALQDAPPDALSPDIPIAVVLGGIYRLLASRLRRGEPTTASLRQDLLDWIGCYEVPTGEHRWRGPQPLLILSASPHVPGRFLAPEPLPPGRPTLSPPEVEANQRQRIMFAASALADEKGYAGTTITEIAKRARVDLRTFYALFSEKPDVFLAIQERGFQEVMSVAAAAYFAAETWPERCWEGGLAFLQFFEAFPDFGRAGLVETHAVPGGPQRLDDIYRAFTVFLEEGVQYSTKPTPPSRIAMEAIVATYFEIVYREVRAGRPPLPSFPSISHLWNTPFLGPSETNRFIDEQLSAAGASTASADPS